MQGEQVALVEELYLPASQLVQPDAVAKEYVPGGQL
jgi:hypothetical protein